jgi:P4 family phage/plasmid primase-like protien
VGLELSTRDHEKKDYNTWFINVAYDPDKTECKAWTAFLSNVLPDEDARMLLQEIFGYCLLRAVDYQVFFIFPGPPASRKSTTLDVLNYLIGGSYDQINGKVISPFVSSKSLETLGERFGTAGLEHSLVNISSESTYLSNTAESVLKRLTGGDPLNIEYKGKDAFSATANPRIIVATNEIPTFNDRTGALEQRCIILPFDRQVRLSKASSNIAHRLFKAESSAIFNWALEGLIRLMSAPGMRRTKFTRVRAGERALEDHRRDSNPVVEWFDEHLELTPDHCLEKHTGYEDFVSFCNRTGQPPNHPLRTYARFVKAVNAELRRRGLVVGRDDRARRVDARKRCFRGVRLVGSSQLAEVGNIRLNENTSVEDGDELDNSNDRHGGAKANGEVRLAEVTAIISSESSLPSSRFG